MKKIFDGYPMDCPDKEVVREHNSLVCTRDRCEHDKECKYKSVHGAEPLVKAKSDLDLCREHRKKLNLKPELDIGNFKCDTKRNNALLCWEKCPVPSRLKDGAIVNVEKVYDSPKKDGVDDAKAKIGINMDVFTEIGAEPKQQKKIPRAVEDFLTMQAHVISKLAWRPEIWEALYNLSSDEILERLIGKTGLEGVPTIVGGKQPFAVSNKTKKMFEDMEKKLEGEGAEPYDATKEEPLMEWVDEPDEPPPYGRWKGRNLPKGYFNTLKDDEEKLKLCKDWRKRTFRKRDFRNIDCEQCLSFEGCPIWAKKEEKNT